MPARRGDAMRDVGHGLDEGWRAGTPLRVVRRFLAAMRRYAKFRQQFMVKAVHADLDLAAKWAKIPGFVLTSLQTVHAFLGATAVIA